MEKVKNEFWGRNFEPTLLNTSRHNDVEDSQNGWLHFSSSKEVEIQFPHPTSERVSINVALFSYTRPFGDGPRNFEHG
ncbi:hypothetical protein TNCV_2089791 [Trichonephila clavipes]|nr:hypothetical protein TNCV_2089791 [Trichonephila clavipes]